MWTVEETYVVFEFEEAALAEQAKARISEWANAFRLAFGQLAAATESHGQRATLIVRLAFGEHERLADQRWRERLAREEPFAQAFVRFIEPGDADFAPTKEKFRRLAREQRK